jgi:hypothetical protein
MMIGSIGSGGGMNFHSMSSALTQPPGNAGETGSISDMINSKGAEASGGLSGGGGSITQPMTGAGPTLSSDTINFLLMSSMDSSGCSTSGGSEKGSISEMLALANQAYNAATNLQSNAGSGITGIDATGGLGGGGRMSGIVT